MDLEAVELALRASVHQAGAAALSQWLQFDPPAPEQRHLPCSWGHQAKYLGLRAQARTDRRRRSPNASAPITYVNIAIKASFRQMSISTLRIWNSRRACAAC
jgi:hypothetical protein